MKRNKTNQRAARRGRAKGRRSYADKRASGDQMYGPGCCAHGVKLPNHPKGG